MKNPRPKARRLWLGLQGRWEPLFSGLVILPKVSDGAAKCAKAIETLQNLAANTDAVYAYRSDIYSGISIGMMAYRVEAVDRLINLIKEARPNESETQNRNGDADSRKVEAN